MIEKSSIEFINMLASNEPVPGGGGASALVGAIGIALGSMVGNLTLGKKKYMDVQQDIETLLEKAKVLQEELLQLVLKDAEVFEPLSTAYKLPKRTAAEIADRERIMEDALKLACSVPLQIMGKAATCIELHEEFLKKGTKLAISDVGVGVLLSKSAMMGASLNVFINTNSMKDRKSADGINLKANAIISTYAPKADYIYRTVLEKLNITALT